MCFTPLDSAHILYCTRVLCVCVCVCTATHLALFRDKRFHILVWFLHPLFPRIHLSLSSLNYAHLSHSFIKSYHSDCGGGDPAHYVVCLASAISSRDSPQTPASHWAGGGNQSRRGGIKKKSLLHHILKAAGWLRTRFVSLACRCTQSPLCVFLSFF